MQSPSTIPITSTTHNNSQNQTASQKLNVVRWVRNRSGDSVAVVRDVRGTLWYVMGSDVSRIEQGLQPLVRPQPVRVTTRSRSS